ncbi:proline-rich protein 18-like [Vombatus ursinus]|uniref:proline-rich protein 18-like n=1 Tax=Vombatus ursinus TaxID=29139 RepID=UPI000FFD005D|nr:proline-rich protein 18-like [Vombatus ursinus]
MAVLEVTGPKAAPGAGGCVLRPAYHQPAVGLKSGLSSSEEVKKGARVPPAPRSRGGPPPPPPPTPATPGFPTPENLKRCSSVPASDLGRAEGGGAAWGQVQSEPRGLVLKSTAWSQRLSVLKEGMGQKGPGAPGPAPSSLSLLLPKGFRGLLSSPLGDLGLGLSFGLPEQNRPLEVPPGAISVKQERDLWSRSPFCAGLSDQLLVGRSKVLRSSGRQEHDGPAWSQDELALEPNSGVVMDMPFCSSTLSGKMEALTPGGTASRTRCVRSAWLQEGPKPGLAPQKRCGQSCHADGGQDCRRAFRGQQRKLREPRGLKSPR